MGCSTGMLFFVSLPPSFPVSLSLSLPVPKQVPLNGEGGRDEGTPFLAKNLTLLVDSSSETLNQT